MSSGGEDLRRAFERVAAAREAPDQKVAAEGVRVLTFVLSGELHAFRLTDLVEVVGSVEPTPIPFAPPHVPGVVNHRGAIVPVVDLRRAFGLQVHYRRESGRTILVRHGDAIVGFLADAIAAIRSIPATAIEPPLATMEASRARFLEGCVRLDNQALLAVLSVAALFEGLSAPSEAE